MKIISGCSLGAVSTQDVVTGRCVNRSLTESVGKFGLMGCMLLLSGNASHRPATSVCHAHAITTE